MTRGQLGDAIACGAGTVEALMRETSASTVCGTCRPLLQELVGGKGRARTGLRRAHHRGRLRSLAALIALAAILLPAWPYSHSVEAGIGLDRFWIDGTWKQVTGFTLVGAVGAGRVSVDPQAHRAGAGSATTSSGASCTPPSAPRRSRSCSLHTGFNLGNNLNRWLMVTFLTVAVVGSVTGIVTAREHAVLAGGKPSRRGAVTWLHILAFWPLPVLLLLHVVTVYAY